VPCAARDGRGARDCARLRARAGPATARSVRGSNLLVADDGFEGLALSSAELAQVDVHHSRRRRTERSPCIARAAGLGGFEFACAIPGTAGGASGWCGRLWRRLGGHRTRAVVDADGADWQTPEQLGLSYRHST
jgi:UDP-N-acetylenolpyruvoylglucosamine reductase